MLLFIYSHCSYDDIATISNNMELLYLWFWCMYHVYYTVSYHVYYQKYIIHVFQILCILLCILAFTF